MIRKIKLLLALALILNISNSMAQIYTEKRIEFEIDSDQNNHSQVEFGDKGIVIYYEIDGKKFGDNELRFDLYSTDLEKQKSTELVIPKGYYQREVVQDENKMAMLYAKRSGEYILYVLDITKMKISSIEGDLGSKASVFSMEMNSENVYFGVTKIKTGGPLMQALQKRKLYLHFVDLEKKSDVVKQITIEKKKDYTFSNFQLFRASNEVIVFVDAYKSKKLFDVYAMRYDSKGNELAKVVITKDIDENNLSSISASRIDDGEYIITGKFVEKSSAFQKSNGGIFFGKFNDEKLEYIQYYKFNEFQDFLSYLSEKKQEKLEKKKAKKEKKGKELKINTLIASHDVRKIGDNYIYIGEAYYPTYRTETRTTYVNGVATTTTVQVFDGYQYTHATVVCFDLDGNKLWDNTFKMYPGYKPFHVKLFIEVTESSESGLGLMFSSYSTIYSMSFSIDGENIVQREANAIDSGSEDDKIKSSYSTMVFWYDNFFIASGTQRIKNKEEKEERGKKVRRVYFINKIGFEFE